MIEFNDHYSKLVNVYCHIHIMNNTKFITISRNLQTQPIYKDKGRWEMLAFFLQLRTINLAKGF